MFVVKDASVRLGMSPDARLPCASIQFDEPDAKAAQQQGHHVSCC